MERSCHRLSLCSGLNSIHTWLHWFLTTFCRVLLFPFFRCRKLSFWKIVQHAREHLTRKWANCGLKQLIIWMISFFLIRFIIGYCWWAINAFIFCKLTLLTNLWIILLIIIILWLCFFLARGSYYLQIMMVFSLFPPINIHLSFSFFIALGRIPHTLLNTNSNFAPDFVSEGNAS